MGRNRKMAQASASPAVGKPFNVKLDGPLLAGVEAYTRDFPAYTITSYARITVQEKLLADGYLTSSKKPGAES